MAEAIRRKTSDCYEGRYGSARVDTLMSAMGGNRTLEASLTASGTNQGFT